MDRNDKKSMNRKRKIIMHVFLRQRSVPIRILFWVLPFLIEPHWLCLFITVALVISKLLVFGILLKPHKSRITRVKDARLRVDES